MHAAACQRLAAHAGLPTTTCLRSPAQETGAFRVKAIWIVEKSKARALRELFGNHRDKYIA